MTRINYLLVKINVIRDFFYRKNQIRSNNIHKNPPKKLQQNFQMVSKIIRMAPPFE